MESNQDSNSDKQDDTEKLNQEPVVNAQRAEGSMESASLGQENSGLKGQSSSAGNEEVQAPHSAESKNVNREPAAKYVVRSEEGKKYQSLLNSDAHITDKVERGLELLDQFISDEENPNFFNYWDVKALLSSVFNDRMNAEVRKQYFKRFSDNGRRAKEIKTKLTDKYKRLIDAKLEAIGALKESFDKFDEYLADAKKLEVPKVCHEMQRHREKYEEIQHRLNALAIFSNTMTMLANEVRDQLPAAVRGKVLQKHSNLGNAIFPERNRNIKEISAVFKSDVEAFKKKHFSGETPSVALHSLRNEVKGMQAIANQITINTGTYKHVRKVLSECWNKIEGWRKAENGADSDNQGVFTENAQAVVEEINKLAEKCKEGISDQDLEKDNANILRLMREKALGSEVKRLNRELAKAKKPYYDKINEKKEAVEKQKAEMKRKENEQFEQLVQDAKEFSESASSLSDEQYRAKLEVFEKQLRLPVVSDVDQAEIGYSIQKGRLGFLKEKQAKLESLSGEEKEFVLRENDVLSQEMDNLLAKTRVLQKKTNKAEGEPMRIAQVYRSVEDVVNEVDDLYEQIKG